MSSPPRTLRAAGSGTAREQIRGEVRPAAVLGAFPTALYLQVAGGDVVAVLTRDAVRLPLGLVVPRSSVDHRLDGLVGAVRVGGGEVRIGATTIRMSRVVSASAPTGRAPDPRLVAYAASSAGPAQAVLASCAGLVGHHPGQLSGGHRGATTAARRCLGAGPGLTPSGDDLLAGFLVAAWSFGLDVGWLRRLVFEEAGAATTALSAALLRAACRGEAIPQVSALVSALSSGLRPGDRHAHVGVALDELSHVGQSSGTAMTLGVLAAARVAG